MQNYIDYAVLDDLLLTKLPSIMKGDRALLLESQELLKLAREIDYSIKTKTEYKTKQSFVEFSHGPGRLAIFLLNYFGECYLHKGLLTIKEDDPTLGRANHTNTYQLELKDLDTHLKLYKGNPTKEDDPYDFNTIFVKQISQFIDTGRIQDTTKNPWDSYQNTYTEPSRTLDFKSAFWNSGSEHEVNYILQLSSSKELICYTGGTKERKNIVFTPSAQAEDYFNKYFTTLSLINYLDQYQGLTWNNFILKETA